MSRRQQTIIQAPEPPAIIPKALSFEDAAEAISVGRSTVYEMVDAGVLGCVQISERKRVIPVVELERYLAANLKYAPPKAS